MRVSAWITRFINDCRKTKKGGRLTISEIQCQDKFYTKREQRKVEHSENFEESRKQLNLLLNCEGIYDLGFIKTTDPLTTYHLPTDAPTTYPSMHRLTIINIVKIEDQILNLFCTL